MVHDRHVKDKLIRNLSMLNFSGEVTGSYPEELSSILRAWTIYGIIVKWLSQQTFNLPIPGSSPGGPTI